VGLEVKYRQLTRQVGVFIEHPPESSMVFFHFTGVMPDEGTTFTFGSRVCNANGSGGFKNHLANPKKPEASAPISSHDIDNLSDDLSEIKLSNLIGSYASHIKVNPRPSISPDGLIVEIDQVDDGIAECIKLAEVALHQPDPASSTQNRPETPHHPPVATGDIFSGIDRVDQGIVECINFTETTLQCINPREPKAFDRDFDDFIELKKCSFRLINFLYYVI
jgi:hypothetical protein